MFLICLAWFNSIVSTALISVFALTYNEWWDYLWIILIFIGCTIASHLWNFVYFALGAVPVRVKGDFINKPSKFYHWAAEECLIFLKYFIGFKLKVEGLEKVPKQGRFVLLVNHKSNFDGLICSIVLKNRQISFISKKEIFDIPIVKAYVYKMGYLKLDRDDVRQNVKVIRKAQEYLEKDFTCIGVCPEGTRNKTDEPLLPFKPGATKVAFLAKVPVVIVTMKGAETIGKNFPFKRAKVFFRVVETINYEDYKNMTTVEFTQFVEDKMRASVIGMQNLK